MSVKAIKQILNTNYYETANLLDDGFYYRNKRLISASKINECFKPFNANFIEASVLEKAVIFGKLLHAKISKNTIEIENIRDEHNEIYSTIKDDVETAYNECRRVLNENGFKLVFAEKFIHNENFVGIIDLIARRIVKTRSEWFLIDIKTSSKNEIDSKWLIQLAVYNILFQKQFRYFAILHYNKKTKKATFRKISLVKIKQISRLLDKILNIYKVKEKLDESI